MTLTRCGNQIGVEEIRRKLAMADKTPRREIDDTAYRNAAVLLPLACFENRWHLLFTRRSDALPEHRGQVSFPGGVIEAEDRLAEDAALRETYEEIGIQPRDIQILGRLRDFPTITGYLIKPVVGVIPWPYPLTLSTEEVSRVFLIPIEWLADPGHQEEIEMVFPNGWKEKVIHFQLYDNEKVWGATARIAVDLLKALELIK